MRIRRKPWAKPELAQCAFFVSNPNELVGKWSNKFDKKQPIHLELGCGKGSFIARIAFENEDINYIATDVKSEMLACTRRNIVNIFQNKSIDNVLLTACDIQRIDSIFCKEDIIERIYINFCNPWHKRKHKKRRLTYPLQLNKYKVFLKDKGKIFFKTDDDELFEESKNYFIQCGFDIVYNTYDLHKENLSFNIETEHEKMFITEGCKIKFLIAQNNLFIKG